MKRLVRKADQAKLPDWYPNNDEDLDLDLDGDDDYQTSQPSQQSAPSQFTVTSEVASKRMYFTITEKTANGSEFTEELECKFESYRKRALFLYDLKGIDGMLYGAKNDYDNVLTAFKTFFNELFNVAQSNFPNQPVYIAGFEIEEEEIILKAFQSSKASTFTTDFDYNTVEKDIDAQIKEEVKDIQPKRQAGACWVKIDKEHEDQGERYLYDDSKETMVQRGTLIVDKIKDFPGYNGENRRWTEKDGRKRFGTYSEQKWKELLEDIYENGIEYPIMVNVYSDGGTYIYEGNHRIQACLQLGIKEIPAEVRYYGGAELIYPL